MPTPTPRRPRSRTGQSRGKVANRNVANQLGKNWYDGTHFLEGQRFGTFLHSSKRNVRLRYVSTLIKKIVPNPSQATALEIGPGNAPVLPLLPFSKMVFMDQSLNILQTLQHLNEKGHISRLNRDAPKRQPVRKVPHAFFVQGDVRALPFNTSFDLIVANELLTHVPPTNRFSLVTELERKSNSMVIIDRPWLSIEDLRKKQMEVDAVGTLARPTTLHRLQATLVDFNPLVEYLEQKGWSVQLKPVKGGWWNYIILIAKRMPKK